MPPTHRPRVFLTGVTGTVGRGIMAALLEDGGYDVTALVRRPADVAMVSQSGAQGVIGDLTDSSCFEQLRATHDFDFVIHAAQASYHHHPPDEISHVERMAVSHLERLASPVTRLMIFTAGVWRYGTGAEGGRISEQTPRRPFAAAQRREELVQKLLARRASPWLVLDPPSIVYGPTGPLQTIVRALRSGASIHVLDDDRVLWSVIEQNDLGRAYVALLRHGRPGDTFVIAEDEPVSVPGLYETIAQRVGTGRIVRSPLAAFFPADADERIRHQTSQPVDAALIRTRTGWRPHERFADTFPRFLT